MLLEVVSTMAFGGLAGYSYIKSNGSGPAKSDSDKILKIFNNAGLSAKGETIRIIRKEKLNDGMLYVFQLPLGLGSEKVVQHKKTLEDGLNTRSRHTEINLTDFKYIKWDKTIIKQIKKILTSKKTLNKEITIDFDGMLKISVYDNPIPNKIPWNDDMLKPGTWSVPVGMERKGVKYHDLDKTKHLIIAGVPGSGKSVIMKLIITALIMQKPADVTFSLIDLKGGPAFARFKDCKQVKNLGVDNPSAVQILKDVQTDMENVYKNVLVKKGYEDITEAGIKKRHIIVIDEAADLAGDKEAVEILTDIVRKGRGSGHYVVYATQYPTVQTVASQIKRNIPARLTYVLDSAIASNAVLDTNGAEELPEIPGRGIYKMAKQTHIQTPFMSNEQIKERISPHITINPRKDDENESGSQNKGSNEEGKYTLEFIETRLLNSGSNPRNPQFKR